MDHRHLLLLLLLDALQQRHCFARCKQLLAALLTAWLEAKLLQKTPNLADPGGGFIVSRFILYLALAGDVSRFLVRRHTILQMLSMMVSVHYCVYEWNSIALESHCCLYNISLDFAQTDHLSVRLLDGPDRIGSLPALRSKTLVEVTTAHTRPSVLSDRTGSD